MTGEIETGQGHDDATRDATGAFDAAEKGFERLIVMRLEIGARGLGGALGVGTMAEAVNDADEGVSIPLTDEEGIAIFGEHAARAGGGGDLEGRGGGSGRGPDPALTDDPQADAREADKIEVIHQTVDSAQARAERAGGGEAVGDGHFDVGNAGAGVHGFDLKTDAAIDVERAKNESASAGVLDQIGGQLGGNEGQLIAGARGEAEAGGKAARGGSGAAGFQGGMDVQGESVVAGLGHGRVEIHEATPSRPRNQSLRHFLRMTVTPWPAAERISISSMRRLAPGKPMPRPSPVE